MGFSPHAQGLLPDRYWAVIPADSRIARDLSLPAEQLNDETRAKVAGLRAIADRRGQTLAAMALAWTLRDPRITSTLVGASSVQQLEANLRALERLDFSDAELAEIDRFATDSDINIWEPATET
jgi:L-glyceraldehyde 3-phosphate reductase